MGRPPSYDHTMLLREIIDCLWERGYAATPISVIVQETGVNAASLYARFGSKKGIMLAALDLYARQSTRLKPCWPRRSREPDKYAPSWNMPWAVLRTRVREGAFW